MKKKIYIAGPLFNKHERGYLEDIAEILEKEGFDCFLPHRDLTGVNESELKTTTMSQDTKNKIFVADLNALKESDLTVALITGWDIDSGTSAEIGYTYANGKPIIGIDASERRFRNLFVEGMISEKVNDISAIIPAIKRKLYE
tara:strand:- start:375 stop:803 length:429 start_codon:yes stop_codon:yes gene_type:complete